MLRLGRFLRWTVAVLLTGLLAGLAGMALALLLHAVQHVAFGYSIGLLIGDKSFLAGVSEASKERRVAILAICGLVAGFGWLAVHRYGRPLVSIAQALKAKPPSLPFAVTIVHACLQIVTVALGSPLGREVAPREVGSALAGRIAQRAGLSMDHCRILVACGAGAGLAAVYNVPLGGAVFVLEGLLGTLEWAAVVPALVTSVVAAWVARIGLGDVIQYRFPTFAVTGSLVAWSIVMGPIVGSAAYWFNRINAAARAPAPRGGVWLPILCILNFSMIGVLSIWFPQLLGNGRGPVQLALADIAWPDPSLGIGLAASLLALRLIIVWSSLRAGAYGGLLTPGLACGALLAIVLGGAWSIAWPGVAPGAFALVGAAAFLAVSMRMPVTAAVLIFEFTQANLMYLLPVVAAVVLAVSTSNLWSRYVGQGRDGGKIKFSGAFKGSSRYYRESQVEMGQPSANSAELAPKVIAE